MRPERRKVLLSAVFGYVTGVVMCSGFFLAYQFSRKPWKPALLRDIDNIPKIGKGNVIWASYEPQRRRKQFRMYHWDTRKFPPQAQAPDVLTWVQQMDRWCAQRAKIVGRYTFNTEGSYVLVLVFQTDQSRGQLLCAGLEGGPEGTPVCAVAVGEAPRQLFSRFD